MHKQVSISGFQLAMSDLKVNLVISVLNDYARSKIVNSSMLQLTNLLIVDGITKLNSFSFEWFTTCWNKYAIGYNIANCLMYIFSLRWRISLLVCCILIWRRYHQGPSDNDDSKDIKCVDNENGSGNEICIDISNMSEYIIDLYQFMDLHRTMFVVNTGYRYVKCYDKLFSIYNEPIQFYDTIHNVQGHMRTEYSTRVDNDKKVVTDFKVLLNIHSSELNDDYMIRISKYVRKQTRSGNNVRLTYNRILSDSMIHTEFYNKNVLDWKVDQSKLKECYFSPHKKSLFGTLEAKMNEDITTAGEWNNLLLYGKPGLGKSSFIYRMATILKKNILSIDLSMYIDRKRDLFAIFNNQPFKLPNTARNNSDYHIQNCIIVLEEFDQSITRLMTLEKIHAIKEEINSNTFKMGQLDVGEIKSDSIIKINKVLRDLIEINNQECQSNMLRLGDLLELFQSVVPIEDRMIIATTNYVDTIKDALPALVRPGRLTLVEFEYLDWSSFRELCDFYFKDCASYMRIIDKFDITVCTSYLVETAIKYKNISGEIADFIAEVKIKCSTMVVDAAKQDPISEKKDGEPFYLEDVKILNFDKPTYEEDYMKELYMKQILQNI